MVGELTITEMSLLRNEKLCACSLRLDAKRITFKNPMVSTFIVIISYVCKEPVCSAPVIEYFIFRTYS